MRVIYLDYVKKMLLLQKSISEILLSGDISSTALSNTQDYSISEIVTSYIKAAEQMIIASHQMEILKLIDVLISNDLLKIRKALD